VTIPPNKSAAVTVTVVMSQVMSNERLRTNKVKPVADAIYLQSGGVVVAEVGASIFNSATGVRPADKTVLMPVTEAPTDVIPRPAEAVLDTLDVDFGRLPQPGDSLPTREILLSNPNERPVECTVRTLVNWLNVEPLRFTIAPKNQFRLKALLTEAARKLEPNRYIREDGVQVDWNGQPHNVRVALTVEKPAAPPSGADRIDFGLLSLPAAQYPAKEISIFNSGIFPSEILVRSSVPWLTVTPEKIQCPSKQTCTVTVALNPNCAVLPEGPLTQADAVLVEIAQKVQRYSVKLEIVKTAAQAGSGPDGAGAVPGPKEYVIDFGEVTDLAAGFPTRSFQLTNTSNQAKDGKVLATNFIWLTVTPTEFHIEPNGRVDLKVQLNRSAKARNYNEEAAIVIELSGMQIPIRVKANVRKSLATMSVPMPVIPPPLLNAEPTSPVAPPEPTYAELDLAKGAEQLAKLENIFDFGTYSSSPDALPTRTVALVNTSGQTISGTLRINDVPWLTVDPTRFECAPGAKVLVNIALADAARSLRPKGKPYRAADAVCLETGTQTFCLRASVQIQAPAVP
jgi:hypothetical protein